MPYINATTAAFIDDMLIRHNEGELDAERMMSDRLISPLMMMVIRWPSTSNLATSWEKSLRVPSDASRDTGVRYYAQTGRFEMGKGLLPVGYY